MSEIDWSKAPEGATYCAPEGLSREPQVCWYRRHEGRWEYFSPNRREWRLSANGPEFHDRLIPRPTQWRGPEDGLPPVGTVCEADADTRPGGYEPCLVVWHDPAPDDDCHPVLALFKSRHATKFDEPEWCSDFRPLKSDKDRAIDAAVAATILKDGPRLRFALSDIYDAGLLRLPEEQS